MTDIKELTRVNIPDPDNKGARIVGFRIREGDEAWGQFGLSEPLWHGLIAAAPSASMGRVTVKALEWHRFERGANSYFANTLLGRYSAWDFDGIDGHYMPPDGYAGTRVDGGLEAAKAAAQAHFDSIILAALRSQP